MASRLPIRALPALLAAGVIVALALLLSGSHRAAGASAAASAGTLSVTEEDFHIQAPAYIKAGEVVLRVHNRGPDEHELIIVPMSPGALPLRPDGLTVNEETVESQEPGSLEPGQPGSTRDLVVTLRPGRYTFFCNMEGHFMAGMHAEVVVS